MKDGGQTGPAPGDGERAEQDGMIAANLARIGRKILVMSGKGGVGKSTVAAYLSLLLSERGRRVGLLDADLHGPSIPRLLHVGGGLEMPVRGVVQPYRFSDNLGVVSLEMMMGDRDTAVIWRGPMKISAIRQFVSDIEWGDLDYLVVDSPPGTGDEPLTVAQTIPDAEALIVTTPQEISLADVRKSIHFCRQVGVEIRGILENMSGLACPRCGEKIPLFGAGGARELASRMGLELLGEVPIEPQMVRLGDQGRLADLARIPGLELNRVYEGVVERIERRAA